MHWTHANLVEEVAMQLDRDEANIIVDKRIAVLRDRSPSWIIDCPNTKDIQAFEMCTVRGFNLSFESLTGFKARGRLRDLKNADPEFWKELTGSNEQDVAEIACAAIVADVLGQNVPSGVGVDADGNLMSTVEAQKLTFEVLPAVEVTSGTDEDGEELGRGRRKRKPNTLYAHSFWRHDDGDS